MKTICRQIAFEVMIIKRRVIFVGFLCLIAINNVFCENIVKEDGVLVVKYYDGAGQIHSSLSSTNLFSAFFNGNGNWSLQIHPLQNSNTIMFGKDDEIYASFDGSNTFYTRVTEAVYGMTNGRPEIVSTSPVNELEHQAYISSGNYPFFPLEEQRRAQVLWLMYGFGNYIANSKTNIIPLPWLPARLNLLAYGFRAESEMASGTSLFPKMIKFIRDTNYDLNDNDELARPELDKPNDINWQENLLRQLKQRKETWHQGMVAGLFEVESNTNYNGSWIPISFTTKVFYPSGQINRSYFGMVTNVSNIFTTNIFAPSVAVNFWVEDSRLRFRDGSKQIDSIGYHIKKGGGWPDTNSRLVSSLMIYYLKNNSLSSKHYFHEVQISRIILRGFFLVSPFVCWFLIKKFGIETKQKNKKGINK